MLNKRKNTVSEITEKNEKKNKIHKWLIRKNTKKKIKGQMQNMIRGTSMISKGL